MKQKIDHLETLVRQLKPDCIFLKDQNVHLTKQMNELKASESKLESQNKEQEMKTELLGEQSQRDNLRFYGFDDKSDESCKESETKVRNYIDEHHHIDEASIRMEQAHRIQGKTLHEPL